MDETQDVALEDQAVIRQLFQKGKTANQIAERTKYSPNTVLLFLTNDGFYSDGCSTCTVKRCYECPGLKYFGLQTQSARILKELTTSNESSSNP